ncbi:papilin-like [Physella acuta]|uniref:papilin-like n=1 Tax=Physella acuta TaxID=109671 RepID=UPI0027DC40DD|nr:papilin-like [Physella acuta]XP_059165657.1 papilin-like [Physella acuta]XP_059165667.1 papilin-like [Physella acuta]XP_059165670.1 papilin-like [Physella acuta]XP_059165678.1 papilin-like [Physella acuta]XP_059165685.1 papilin-like [Physella acuta]
MYARSQIKKLVNKNRTKFIKEIPAFLFIEGFPGLQPNKREELRCKLRNSGDTTANSYLLDAILRLDDFYGKFIQFCTKHEVCSDLVRLIQAEMECIHSHSGRGGSSRIAGENYVVARDGDGTARENSGTNDGSSSGNPGGLSVPKQQTTTFSNMSVGTDGQTDSSSNNISAGSNMVSTDSSMVSTGSNMVSTGSNNISAGSNISVATKKPTDAGSTITVATINEPTDAGSTITVATINEPTDAGSTMTVATINEPTDAGSTITVATINEPTDAGSTITVATISEPTDAGSNMVAMNQSAGNKDVSTEQPADEGSNMIVKNKQQTDAAATGQEMTLDVQESSRFVSHTHKDLQDVHSTKKIPDIYNTSSKNTKQNVPSSVTKHFKRARNTQENFLLLFRFLINSYNWSY